MRVLFIVQGEGRGHLTQAISLKQMFHKAGHDVAGVLVGKSASRELPLFFKEKIGVPVSTFESPNFLPTAKNKRVNLTRSLLYNLARLPLFFKSVLFIRQQIDELKPDLVVNFYELMTGFTYGLFRPSVPMVAIAHQYIFLHPEYEFPAENRLALFFLKFFTRLTSWGAKRRLALSFRKMRAVPERRITVVPPLLRDEVRRAVPQKGDHLLGYILNSGFASEIEQWHSRFPKVRMHLFWDKKDAPACLEKAEGLFFHRLNDRTFIELMSSAKAYATTAGFESVCEAMYLGKPVLMVPTHIEQSCNAFDAMLSGAGITFDRFDLDRLLELSEKEKPLSDFRFWADQAEWLIIREFGPELWESGTPSGWFGHTTVEPV